MRRCDNCKTEILFDDVQFCEHCGATLAPAAAPTVENDDDFEVTESAADRAESDATPRLRPRTSDDLGLQSSAEMIQDLNRPDKESETDFSSLGSDKTGQSSPSPTGQPLAPGTVVGADGLRRLSADQVKSIEKNLYGSTKNYLSEDEKSNLLKTVRAAEETSHNGPATPKNPKANGVSTELRAGSSGAISTGPKRSRGIAYYMKNYIQVRGDLELRDNDEIQINSQSFLLRRKRLSPKVMLSLAGAGFAICLVIIGSLILSNPGGSNGQIVGFALDDSGQPYLLGATIHLPEIGQTYTSNGQGFFRTDKIAPGSYRVEYVVGGQKVATDYATIASGEITTLSLKPSAAEMAQLVPEQTAPAQSSYVPANNRSMPNRQSAPSRQTETQQAAPSRKPELSRITVAANVDNARFTLDGDVIGAGNTTFNSIKPGRHSYVISKDGFVPVGGSLSLAAGETRVIQANLTPAANEPPKTNYRTEAQNAVKSGNYEQAVDLLTKQLAQTPDQADLYTSRAEAYAALGVKQDAADDYCKAAQLYQGKNGSQALTCYNLALKQTPKSVSVLLSRGNLYLKRGEDIAAIADFESAINLDKRNAQAFVGLGEARYNQGNYDQAIKYFKEARSLSPNDPYVHQYLMLAYLGDDDLKNMKKSYDKFMELSDQAQKNRMKADRRFDAALRVLSQEP